ncbi:hypothetical protein GFY24_25255 [Nocardia sp. SYP-A9097]|uniref:hypothetical protein n=1 Tax=Nocardia sp. SYP-A9097 TaxID=2663237 RepID=UPI00129AFC30|nr:hypothetical protein [Nocardia sp. SYP-A9097]MRH90708.1 hypothetical protein [Nocardia sp. SYP-A9097]
MLLELLPVFGLLSFTPVLPITGVVLVILLLMTLVAVHSSWRSIVRGGWEQ